MSLEPVLVRFDAVSRTFGAGPGAVVALHGASLELRAGQQVALVGPSGSGKSTLLHLMAGLDRPTVGTVAWPGLDFATLRPRGLGIVPQGNSLLSPLTMAENVALPLVLAGEHPARAAARAQEALGELGLELLAERLPDELSSGQAQRAAVARVLAIAPRVMLADEPTGRLDGAAARAVVAALLEGAARVGAALVVCTHDPDAAGRLQERWEMRSGRLILPTCAA